MNIINEIQSIISLPSASTRFNLDDPNLTKSCQMSSLKQNATKCANQNFQNLTKNVLDQKWSQLCVPISVTSLLRHAIRNDLGFQDQYPTHTFERILSTLTMIVYPRSMVGLNLNPKESETDFQMNDILTLLKRVCQKTYLVESGWDIIRLLGATNNPIPSKSICVYGQRKRNLILLNQSLFSSSL